MKAKSCAFRKFKNNRQRQKSKRLFTALMHISMEINCCQPWTFHAQKEYVTIKEKNNCSDAKLIFFWAASIAVNCRHCSTGRPLPCGCTAAARKT